MYGSSHWQTSFPNAAQIASSSTSAVRFDHRSTRSTSSSDESSHGQPEYSDREDYWLSSSPVEPSFQQSYIQVPEVRRVNDVTPSGYIVQWSRYVAVSAQWVYCGDDTKVPALARVSVTDCKGLTLLDVFVHPVAPVSDYRFTETGLQSCHLQAAPCMSDVRARVQELIRGKIIIGYQLWNFLSLLQSTHPALETRDIASFIPFRRSLHWRRTAIVPLPVLVNKFMGRGFGNGYEHPLENARACLDLFRSSQGAWEDFIQQGHWPCSTVEDVPSFAYGCFT